MNATMVDVSKIKKALKAAGYDSEPTESNLIECYLDYFTAYGGDIEEVREDIADGSLTINQMCNALIRCN
jgi:hypothetical protein